MQMAEIGTYSQGVAQCEEVPACGLSLSGLVQLDADKLAVVIKALADELQVQ